MNNLKRSEGNIIKRMLGISTRCHTSDLYQSLNITLFETVYDKIRLSFWSRLIKNNLTNYIIDELFKINELADYDCLLNIFYKNNDELSCTRATIANSLVSLSNPEEINQQLDPVILKTRNISKHCNKQLKLIEQDKLFRKRVNLNDTIAKQKNLRGEM